VKAHKKSAVKAALFSMEQKQVCRREPAGLNDPGRSPM